MTSSRRARCRGAYGAYRADEGVSERALFVLDADGVIRWSYLSPIGVNPGADGIFKALESLARRDQSTATEAPRRRHPGGSAMSTLTPPVSERDHIAGPADAPVTLVEYGDYECPYCGMAYPIVKAAQKRLGAELRFVFRNFPLKEIHPHAQHAAEAAESAAAQGKFWEMHDVIFEHQHALEDADLVAYASDARPRRGAHRR